MRLVQYFSNRSLWLDEAMLALNVLHRPYSEFLKPLDLNQAAPFGFLLVEKAAVDLLGNSELTLRLPALLYGLGSLVLFFYFARHFLRSWELLVAVFLFAFSYRHIYYSSEVKQYGLDVTVVLAMSLIAVRVNSRSPNLAEWLYFGVAGAISLWFSYPAVFVLAAAGSVLSWKALLNRNWRAKALMCVPVGLWLASIGMLLPSLSATAANPYLLRYWESSFCRSPLKP